MVFHVTESSRVLSLIASESKAKRKESLTALEGDCDENLANAANADVLTYCSVILPHLVNAIADSVESHRERSIRIISRLCEKVEVSDCFLPHVSQVLIKRLTIQESIEDSEEIRLCSLKLLHQILLKLKNGACYTGDFCLILQHCLGDNFHEVKITCCDILRTLSTKYPGPFYQYSESLLKPLLKNVVHQQHRVRLATVEATGDVFEHCNGKFVDHTIAPLTQRLFDPSSSVRKAVVQVAGEWLLNLCDRYSYHAKLMPLILSGQIDEIEDIRDEANALWYDIGIKYQKENENDLKDKIDFDPGKPAHYPKNQMRPNFGCRELMHRNASRLIPGLCRDLGDWQSETRRKASGLLPIVLLHLEEGITQHTQVLVTGLATGIGDAIMRTTSTNSGAGSLYLILMNPERGLPSLEALLSPTGDSSSTNSKSIAPSAETSEALHVIQQLFTAARYTSCFVSPKVWWKLLHENARRCFEATSPTSLAGNFFLLANLIAGASLDELTGNEDAQLLLSSITAFLTAEEQVGCSAFATKAGLLECANSLTCLLADLGAQLSKQKAATATGDGSTDSKSNLKTMEKVCAKLLEDTFYLLLGISASWEEGVERTEFAVEFNDQVGRLLCILARHQEALFPRPKTDGCKCCQGKQSDPTLSEQEAKEAAVIAEAKQSGRALERLYGRQLPKLLRRLDEGRAASGGWHPKSAGLAIFCHAVLSAGPGLLTGLEPDCRSQVVKPPPPEENCLLLTLQLLETGCKLNQPIDVGKEKSESGPSPLSMSAEAELHLRGLLLLMRLTDHARIRLVLTQPKLFRYCLTQLVLPSCVWRAGRTAEAMRKAAGTSLVALLAAVVPLRPSTRREGDTPTQEVINATEFALDECLNQRLEVTRGSITQLVGKNGLLSRRIRAAELPSKPAQSQLVNLGLVSAASPRILSLLLTRLGGMLTDDIEATRLLACTGLALLFGGIFSGGGEHIEVSAQPSDNPNVPRVFLRSPAWFLPLMPKESTGVEEVDIAGYGDKMPGLTTPLPGSLGDQVYKFYPSLVKALDDVSDEVRLRAADVFVTWFWVMSPNLIDRPPPVPKSGAAVTTKPSTRQLNSVFTGVIEDLTSSVAIHLDDSDALIRTAVARVVLRVAEIAPQTVRRVLVGARERHRSPALCEALLETIDGTV